MPDEFPLRDLDSLRSEMESRWGEPFPFDAAMWALCNERARKLMASRDFDEMERLYLHMAEFLEREGKDCRCVLEEAARARLLSLRQRKVEEVVIRPRDGACDACRLRSGDRLAVHEALLAMPLPQRDCTGRSQPERPCAFCRCTYEPAAPESGPSP